MDHGVDGEAGDGLDAGLVGDVLAVGVDGMDGDVELVGDFFAAQAFGDEDEDIGLAVAELVVVGGLLMGRVLDGLGSGLEQGEQGAAGEANVDGELEVADEVGLDILIDEGDDGHHGVLLGEGEELLLDGTGQQCWVDDQHIGAQDRQSVIEIRGIVQGSQEVVAARMLEDGAESLNDNFGGFDDEDRDERFHCSRRG